MMKKWDYEFVLFSSIAMDKIWELGKQGWELINIVPMIDNKGGHYAIAVLKRELIFTEEYYDTLNTTKKESEE